MESDEGPRKPAARSAAFVVLLTVLLAIVFKGPCLSGCRAPVTEILSGPWFTLAYIQGEFDDPEAAAATIERVGAETSAALELCPPLRWARLSGPDRPVFATQRAADFRRLPSGRLFTLRGTRWPDLAGAAVEAVLVESTDSARLQPGIVAGLGTLVYRGRDEVDAVAFALAGRQRLAGLHQLLAWWPSLPFGREQLASLVASLLYRHGPDALVELAVTGGERCLFGLFGELSSLEDWVAGALSREAASVDRDWVSAVTQLGGSGAPEVVASAEVEVSRGLARARWSIAAFGAAAIAALSVLLLVVLRRGGPMTMAVLAAGLAAMTELVIFTAGPRFDLKAALAIGGTAAVCLGLGWRARRTRGATGAVAMESVWPESRSFPALAGAVLMFLIVMVPRFGLYLYWRQIWGKATMIVFALAIVFLVEKGGLDSVGLGRVSPRRLGVALAAGFAAFRLSEFLTSVVYYSLHATVGNPWFTLWGYHVSWRIAGFHHYPFAPWSNWLAGVDIVDLFFGNFAEELFFRGFLLSRLARTVGWWKAAALQACLFGLGHANYDMFPLDPWPMLFYVLSATSFGFLMALLLRGTSSLLVPSFVHAMYNLDALALGVDYAHWRGGLGSMFDYDLIRVVVGLLVIPAVLYFATGRFRHTGGPRVAGRL